MRIAIVGAGISGLTAAHYLSGHHQVVVFEAAPYFGGHTNTINVPTAHGPLPVDTGFIVFNDRTYPNFCRLLERLAVESQPTTMSFSVQSERTGFEYCGATLNGFFAQRRNLFNPQAYLLLRDFLWFNRQAVEEADRLDGVTVDEFFQRNAYSSAFQQLYFLPMASAIWSCPTGIIGKFPIQFIIQFYRHHGLLSLRDHPQWRVICGGSERYVDRLMERTPAEFVAASPVRSVVLNGFDLANPVAGMDSGQCSAKVITDTGEHVFDHVILACHSDQALQMRGADATAAEREVLAAFPYQQNEALLHTDASVLPVCRRAWAAWNYFLPAVDRSQTTVTYNMNILQGISARTVYCVTLNDVGRVDPEKVIQSITYHHPIFDVRRKAAQARQLEICRGPISYCGAYWGNGFHEDGVNSALNVVNHLAENEQCRVAFTKVG